ncbi:MAG: class I SAM-dependent methyltransferase [Dehalococcoidales bacterium]|nr:class I SAM-dependent methyltransferase [Dehalococcoidales bacterium]
MRFFNSPRVPLREGQFIDSAAARFYHEHARRFMMPIYRGLAAEAGKIKHNIKRVLDIGAGSGILEIELAKAHPDWRITGVDISEEMLKIARDSAAGEGLTERIDFLEGKADALPFKDNSYDLVVSNASLHLWANPKKVLQEIGRVTVRGGYCLIWDNLRIPAFYPLFRMVGWGMGMNKAQRKMWLRAIESGYTAGEAKALIKSSALRHAGVTINFKLLELCIKWQKDQQT